MVELDEALLSARMRALAAFAPDYFHDLRGPLNAIALRLEVLRALPAGEAGDERRRASLSAIEEQTRRLDRLLQGWLVSTVPGDAPDAVCDLGVLAREIAAAVGPRARARRLTFAVDVPDGSLPARAAPAALTTALLDLLRQAMSGLADGGSLGLLVERDGTTVRCRITGGAFAASAVALAARVAGEAGGTCAVDPGGGGVTFALPLTKA